MAIYMMREYDWLCFTANTAGSTIKLQKYNSPTSITLETSTDWNTWSTYSMGSTITLSNIWDKVYFRNTSETDTWFSINASSFYQFEMYTWSIAASWDISSLLNKNLTNNLSTYCFYRLFYNCISLTTPPGLNWTSLADYCYGGLFQYCTWLTSLPKLAATTLKTGCYNRMFYWCSSIKISATQTWDYQTTYRIPSEWTWTDATNSLQYMFTSTWWTFAWTPSINTTYYTSNTVV